MIPIAKMNPFGLELLPAHPSPHRQSGLGRSLNAHANSEQACRGPLLVHDHSGEGLVAAHVAGEQVLDHRVCGSRIIQRKARPYPQTVRSERKVAIAIAGKGNRIQRVAGAKADLGRLEVRNRVVAAAGNLSRLGTVGGGSTSTVL